MHAAEHLLGLGRVVAARLDLGLEDLEVDRVDLGSRRVRRLDVLAPGHLSQQEGTRQVTGKHPWPAATKS